MVDLFAGFPHWNSRLEAMGNKDTNGLADERGTRQRAACSGYSTLAFTPPRDPGSQRAVCHMAPPRCVPEESGLQIRRPILPAEGDPQRAGRCGRHKKIVCHENVEPRFDTCSFQHVAGEPAGGLLGFGHPGQGGVC